MGNKSVKFEMEFNVKSSPTILYDFLTTPSGLAQWFADDVDINEDECSFVWEGAEDIAYILESEEDVFVRYRWEYQEEDEYFEFRIGKSEITRDTILYITDFAPDYDVEDQKLLWENQVKLLKQQIGG